MKTKTKRRIGTSVAVISTGLFLCSSILWYRSLICTDIADHRTATTTDGHYSRRVWSFWSGGGFIGIERGMDVPTAAHAADFEAVDRQFGMGWHGAAGLPGNDGSIWETFCGGITRLSFHQSTERHGRYQTTSRFLEIPYEVPVFALMVPPVIAIVRRHRRIRREQMAGWFTM